MTGLPVVSARWSLSLKGKGDLLGCRTCGISIDSAGEWGRPGLREGDTEEWLVSRV